MKLSAGVVRALVLGVVVGAVGSVSPSCGPPRRPVMCNASTCNGCCDENANCFTGLNDVSCGNSGATCSACPMGQVCIAVTVDGGSQGGRCASNNPTGGGSAGGGTAMGGGSTQMDGGNRTDGGMTTCNAQTCPNGCCSATGVCQNPPTTARCGTGGASCMACPSGRTCVNGACEPCMGCVDIGTGRCEMGTMTDKCGKNGEFCANCQVSGMGNGTCTNQVCTGVAPGCNPMSCPTGCCDQGSNTCVPPAMQSGQQCGQGAAGSLCTSCASGMCDTDGGVCIGGNTGGGIGGGFGGSFPGLDGGFPGLGCDATNPCPAGECCMSILGFGQCTAINGPDPTPLVGALNKACGLSGMACRRCGLFSGGGPNCNVTTGMCQP